MPFWPQLPNYRYYEDMYVQTSENFPGIILDTEKRTLRFSMDKFTEELEETLLRFDDPDFFEISTTYSDVYHRFLELDLADRPAIRGQLEGPISFGFYVLDQDKRPILFDDTVREFMVDFMARRLNVQLSRRLEGVWKILWSKGIDREQLISRSMLSPATCCLINPDKERTVERVFAAVKQMAEMLKVAYKIAA